MIPVCAAILLRSGAVLLARRGPGRSHAGLWEFPGGRIEDEETPATALARELKEELGIVAEIGEEAARTRHTYDFGEIELIALFVRKFTGDLKLSVHDQVKWVEARRLLEYDLAPADIPIAEKLASYRRRDRYTGTHPKSFSEKYKEHAADPEAVAKAKARGSTPAGAHVPIMVQEIIEALAPLRGARVLDCTLGWGGHAEALGREGSHIIGLDRDAEELSRTQTRLLAAGIQITAVHSDYADAEDALSSRGGAADAVLADLGVSSMQLDRPERGMSFKNDGPLDMRMDRSQGKTAAEWLNDATESRIAEVLRLYGDEPDAPRIAARICELIKEGRSPKTTFQLASAVGEAKGFGPGRFKKKDAFSAHPAVRTFQALRIAVNAERESLERFLESLPRLVRRGGKLAILTFHSGEESLVRSALNNPLWTGTREARKASSQEVQSNPRSRSARLWTSQRS